MIRKRYQRPDKGNVTVEFALITALFTLPLLLGALDFVTIISAQAQLNTALQALYYFAVDNPTQANNVSDTTATGSGSTSVLSTINSKSDFQLSGATPVLQYSCYTTGSTSTEGSSVTVNAPSSGTTCSAGQTTMTFANYTLTASVPLPVPLYMLGISNPMQLSASGSVQIATQNN